MEEETAPEQLLHRLYDQVNEHLETRWDYFTLVFTERLSGIASDLAGAFTLILFGLLALFFFCMGFAWWLGDVIQNRAGGFALTGLIFIPIAAIIFKWIRPVVRDIIIDSALDKQEEPKKTEHEQTR